MNAILTSVVVTEQQHQTHPHKAHLICATLVILRLPALGRQSAVTPRTGPLKKYRHMEFD